MDYKLINQILSLTKSLSLEERRVFLRSGKGKPLYIDLFKIFLKYIDSSKAKENIETDALNLDGVLNDNKEYLLKNLIDYVNIIEKKQNPEYFEIKQNIESVTALYNRGQFEIAHELINKTYKKLKKIKPNGTNYHLFLQYINQIFEIQSKRHDAVTRSLTSSFNEKEALEWLNRLTKAAANYISPSNSEKEISSDFNSNLFFNLLNEYLFAKEEFADLELDLESLRFDAITDERINKKREETIIVFKILQDLFKLKAGIRLNDPDRIHHLLISLENSSFFFKERNYQTFIFLAMQIFEFRLEMALNTKDFKVFKDVEFIFNIKQNDLKLFSEKEIEGVALRIEVNKGIVLLLTEEYEKAYKHFSSIPMPHKIDLELKYYIKLYELLCYRMNMKELDLDKFDKDLAYLKNIKYLGSSYSKAFYKLIEKNADGKNLTNEAGTFLDKNIPETAFEKVSHYWIQQIQPK
jgi:hypothetical protein